MGTLPVASEIVLLVPHYAVQWPRLHLSAPAEVTGCLGEAILWPLLERPVAMSGVEALHPARKQAPSV